MAHNSRYLRPGGEGKLVIIRHRDQASKFNPGGSSYCVASYCR